VLVLLDLGQSYGTVVVLAQPFDGYALAGPESILRRSVSTSMA